MIISRETLRGKTIAAKANRMSDPTLHFFQIVDERIMVKPLSAAAEIPFRLRSEIRLR
jgi:hypothetical protein